jgi:hypothetical protein
MQPQRLNDNVINPPTALEGRGKIYVFKSFPQ